MSQSLWFDTASQPGPFPSLERDESADVVIVGGGIAGITAAEILSREGRSVILLEARRIGHGETGHTTAHITEAIDCRYHYLRSRFGAEAAALVAQASRHAIDHIATTVRRLGIDASLRSVDGWLYTENERDVDALRKEAEAASEAGVDASFERDVPLPFSTWGGVRFRDQAEFHALHYLFGLVESLPDSCRLFENSKVVDIDDGDPAVVRTERATVTATDVLVLTNVPINDRVVMQTKLPAYRSYAIAFEHADEPTGLFWDTADPYHYTRTQTIGGTTWMIVGGEDHRTGTEPDTNDCFATLERWASERFGRFSVSHRWSGQIIEPPDGLPYIGLNPGLAKHVRIGAGWSGQGITFGTLAGVMLAEQLLGRPTRWDRLFDPSRKPYHALGTYAAENAAFPAHLASDRLTDRDVEGSSVDDVKPGEGRLIEIGGRKCAVHRAENGSVTLLSPVCPHMGCDVRWNNAESSWDCPCHGSRFSPEGEVLNGPAKSSLERIEQTD